MVCCCGGIDGGVVSIVDGGCVSFWLDGCVGGDDIQRRR